MKLITNLKKILIVFNIVVIVAFIFTLLRTSVGYLNVKTPIISEPYVDSDFANDSFNTCVDNTKSVYDVANCYDSRINKLVDEKNEYTKPSGVYAEIPATNLNKYAIGVGEYRTNIDVGSASYKSIEFSYPNNQFVKSIGGIDKSNSMVTDTEIREGYYSAMEKYQTEKIYYSEDKSAYLFPLSDPNSENFLQLLTFDNNQSKLFSEKISNYLA